MAAETGVSAMLRGGGAERAAPVKTGNPRQGPEIERGESCGAAARVRLREHGRGCQRGDDGGLGLQVPVATRRGASASENHSQSSPCLRQSLSTIPLPSKLTHSHAPASQSHSRSFPCLTHSIQFIPCLVNSAARAAKIGQVVAAAASVPSPAVPAAWRPAAVGGEGRARGSDRPLDAERARATGGCDVSPPGSVRL